MVIELRSITSADVSAVAGLALEVLREQAEELPVHISAPKVLAAVKFFAEAPPGEHFQRAAFTDDGHCVGAMAALVSEMPFFERCEAQVYFCYAKAPGVGVRLIRKMLDWVKREPRIRRVTWLMNRNEVGERMARVIARRFKFDPGRLETLVLYR